MPSLVVTAVVFISPMADADSDPHYPSPETLWSRTQYSDFYFIYFNTHLALPHLRDSKNRQLFERLVSRDNIASIVTGASPSDFKLNELNIILAALGSIRASYNLAVIAGEPLQEELTQIQIFNLYVTGQFAEVAGPGVSTPAWRSVIKTALEGVVHSLSEQSVYSTGQRTSLADALARRFATLNPLFSRQERQRLSDRISALQIQDQDDELRNALARLQLTLTAQ